MRNGRKAGRLFPPLLLLALVSTGTPAAAQAPDISGHYRGDLTFESTGGEGALVCGVSGISFPAEADVQLIGEDDVRLVVTPPEGENGKDIIIEASLDQELQVYTELTGLSGNPGDRVFPFTGQFDVSGSEPSFTGSQRITERCEVPSGNQGEPPTVTFANSKWTIAITRVLASAEILEPPPPSEPQGPTADLISADLADDADRLECPPDASGDLADACEAARRAREKWENAMVADINALNLDLRSEELAELERLRAIVGRAVQLGALLPDELGVMPRFPYIHALLWTFAFLFVQGVGQAATGQIEDLRATVSYADELLFIALEGTPV